MLNLTDLSVVELATVVGGFATALAAAFALVGVPLAIAQIRAMRRIQREATAKILYRQYLEDAINRYDLTVPDLEKIISEGRLVQYELFVAHMLYSLEEIVENTRDKAWIEVCRGQISRHSEYFCSDYFKAKLHYYDPPIVKLVEDEREKFRSEAISEKNR